MQMTNVITFPAQTMQERNKEISSVVTNEKRRLFDFIKRKVNSPEDAEDILQDVFYQFSLHYNVVEPIRDAAAWMFRVAGNKIIDFYRKKKTVSLEGISTTNDGSQDNEDTFSFADLHFDPNEIPDDQYTRSLFWKALSAALDEMPLPQREVFVWHELEGKSFKDIAELTGEIVPTLITRKRYAVVTLREKLKTFYTEIALKK